MALLQNNKLIIKKLPWHANMTEMNHLGATLHAKPAVFKPKMNQLFSTKLYSANPLETLRSMGKIGTRTETSTSWEWEMKGANTRPLVVIDNGNVTTPQGKYNRPFTIKLDTDWWKPGDIAYPGTNDKRYQVRIQEKKGIEGNGCVYTVIVNGPADLAIPAKYLQPGQQWTKLYSQYEEGAEQSGSTQYAMPILLHNRMSRYRKTYKVTGDVQQEVLAVGIQDSKGTFHNSWVKYAEVEYWQQWYRELAIGAWWSPTTDNVIGSTNRPTYSGPGIQEMISEGGHVWKPSYITGRGFEEYIMDIYFGRADFGSRDVACFTGEYGMLEAHRIMTDLMQKQGFQVGSSNFDYVKRVSSPYHSNAYGIGFKFTEWYMTNGSTLRFYHNPLYDDRHLNYEMDPVTGYPLSSMRYTFLDFSDGKAGQNIQLVEKKDAFKNWYVSGGTSPYGAVTNGMGAHSGDYYEVHVQDQCGVHIEDITRCGEIVITRS